MPGPHRGVLRRQLLQPPRPPGHRVRDARRDRPRGRRTRTTSPSTSCEGLAVHQVQVGVRSAARCTRHVDRHRRHPRAQDRRAVLPRQPADRDRRVVPRVPAQLGRGSGPRRRRALRGELPPPRPLVPSRAAGSSSDSSDVGSGMDGYDPGRGVGSIRRHSAWARSTRTATIPTPPAAITAPMRAPSRALPSLPPSALMSASP